jgi:molybdopterin-guanine dinucleotide biosynthesis protein A
MLTFSTALLAGGASTRMGRDKVLLKLPESGELLWERQWKLLEELGAKEMFWSGPPREGIPFCARVVADSVPGVGPLAGVSACLEAMRTDQLIVLAVDLPEMEGEVLFNLLARCTKRRGAVYQHGEFFEPLAAIYPKMSQALAADHLAQGRYAMQDFIREAVQREMMAVVPLPEGEVPYFKNVNAPGDM